LDERLRRQLAFITEIDKMKSIYRQTLVIDRSRHENDAEHSWHLAMAVILLQEYSEKSVDLLRVLKMTLVHDLVEIYAGDTFAYDAAGYSDKTEREKKAADSLFAMLPAQQGTELRTLWEEFEKMDTSDALYAAALDRLLPFISNAMTDGYTWVKHKITAAQIYKRMEPIKLALPRLWPYITETVQHAVSMGYVTDDA
jgi:putative hydrolase of HD superfamily